jgi:RNA-directed DNA polymerase
VRLSSTLPQMSTQMELPWGGKGEALTVPGGEEALQASHGSAHSGMDDLMVQVVCAGNLQIALKRVRKNKGSPGIDGMTVDALPDYLRENWFVIREQLVTGTYQPAPVKRHHIPKRDGGVRELGIPTVLDRFIQQAVLQVLQPLFDPGFSEHSYGFRPNRSAHQAVMAARRFVQAGRRIVVDVDLSRFFDRVNHDVLMGKLGQRIADKTILGLIRRFLNAGMMADGVVVERHEGTPQGGPLSPLLANILLDDVDKELERRGHAFARYADDCNVYVHSKRAGQRVMALLRRLYARLKLRINEEKSAVASALTRQFLGFGLWVGPGKVVKHCVSRKALVAMKERVRTITRRTGGRSLVQVAQELRSYLVGWKNYFKLAATPGVFAQLDAWLRHRLRALQLKQWKRGRTIYRELVARGQSSDVAAMVAANCRRWWRNSAKAINIALPNRFFDELGVPRLAA